MTDFVQVPRETLQEAVDALELASCTTDRGELYDTFETAERTLKALLDAPAVEGTYDQAIYGDRRKPVEPLSDEQLDSILPIDRSEYRAFADAVEKEQEEKK